MGRLSRLQLYGLGSTTLFVWAILNAFRQRSNFYSAAVYLSKSNACMMILWNQAIYQTVLFGKLMQAIFFGELRLLEVERLQERGWFAVTETLLALTIFKDDFESSFVILFVSLLFLKVFHWLASDRVEMMEQSAQVTRLAHIRMVGLLTTLWILDALMLLFAIESIMLEGPTVMIMFASEYMILLANVWSISMKYIINCIDLRSEVPWENKSIYGLYVELTADFFKLVTYITFFSLILTFYGLPLNILRDVYLTLRSFVLKVRDLRRYRQATRNMDTLYPDASLEEMREMNDKTCIICREDMEFRGVVPPPTATTAEGGEQEAQAPPPPPPAAPQQRTGPNDTPKKLPCGHVFHFHCLRSWLERQQSCPTCRRPVLPNEQPRPGQPGAPRQPGPGLHAVGNPAVPGGGGGGPAAAQADEAIRQAQINLARNLGREAFGVVFPGLPFPLDAPGAAPAPGQPPANATAGGGGGGGAATPNPTPTPTTPLAGPSSAGPSTSTPTASIHTRLPASVINPGSGLDNPLARFSLPELPLPPTGEAGLFSHPTTTTTGHAGLAYGAVLGGGGTTTGQRGPGVGQAGRVPNLEERLKFIRKRLERSQTPTGTASTSGATATKEDEGVKVKVASTREEEEEETKDDVKGKGKEKEGESGNDPVKEARERALKAAELRRRNASPSPSSTLTTTPTAVVVVEASTPSSILPPLSTLSPSTVPLPPSPSPSPGPPPTTSTTQTYSTATTKPTLTPLLPPFLPLSTISTTSTPRSKPFLPPSPTPDQLKEMSGMTRKAMEERLRAIRGWQVRLERMGEEMQGALEGIEEGEREWEREQQRA